MENKKYPNSFLGDMLKFMDEHPEVLESACYYFRHDFGLIDDITIRNEFKFQIRESCIAWMKALEDFNNKKKD